MTSVTDTQSLTIAPGVVETLVSLAVQQVEGVAALTPIGPENVIRILGRKQPNPAVLILEEEDGQIVVEVHIRALYGYPLPEIAVEVRQAVADALDSQVNLSVSEVNVFIDSIQFAG